MFVLSAINKHNELVGRLSLWYIKRAETLLTTKVESFTNVDTSSSGEPTSPSQALNTFKAVGKTPSFSTSKMRGAIVAKKASNHGTSSTHLARVGNFCFNESTSVSDEMKATGIDQKKHKLAVAAKLNSLPVLVAWSGSPTLRQNTPSGGGAACTIIAVAITTCKSFIVL